MCTRSCNFYAEYIIDFISLELKIDICDFFTSKLSELEGEDSPTSLERVCKDQNIIP